jgi:PAS domain-containing protein
LAWRNWLGRELLARWEPMVERARETDGRIPPSEFRVTAKDGAVHDVELSAVVLGDVVFGTFQDQKERKRALRELERSEASLRDLVENAPIGIVRMELDSERLWMNAAFTGMLGYTGRDVPDFGCWLERAYPDSSRRARIHGEWRKALGRARAGDGRIESTEAPIFCARHEKCLMS